MAPLATRNVIRRLMAASQHGACPCHGCRSGGSHASALNAISQMRKLATPVDVPPVDKEYAFEVRITTSMPPILHPRTRQYTGRRSEPEVRGGRDP